jgi:hypothetical protein
MDLREMQNHSGKIFFTCPFSYSEVFLRNYYGADILISSAPASVLKLEEGVDQMGLFECFKTANIREIYIVYDSSCKFHNAIIKKRPVYNIPATRELLEIYERHQIQIESCGSHLKQRDLFARINIREQARKFLMNCCWYQYLITNRVEIKGVLTSKNENRVAEFEIPLNQIRIGFREMNLELLGSGRIAQLALN